jgi:hypothetical protein
MLTPFRFYSKIRRTIDQVIFRRHPSSSPYITGDSFRSISNHVYDYDSKINPSTVKKGDIVFVSTWLIPSFFKFFHSEIKHPYILLTLNADPVIDDSYIRYLDDKIIHWFAQNPLKLDPRITPLPIGIENKSHHRNGITFMINFFTRFKKTKDKILYGFSVSTNPKARTHALDVLKKIPVAEAISGFPEPLTYFSLLSRYKFVASPPGNCPDTHRGWEALHLKTIPIAPRWYFIEYFAQTGLPFWVIDDWSELEKYTEADLAKKYENMMRDAKWDALWFDYWEKKIYDVRDSYLKSSV